MKHVGDDTDRGNTEELGENPDLLIPRVDFQPQKPPRQFY